MKNIDWGLVLCTGLLLLMGAIGALAAWTEVERQAKLTPEQRQAEQHAREERYKEDRRKDDSVFCSPCLGPHIGMDGKLRYGISPFGIGF